ncbi:DUF4391 domain-containing protein [Corynebacterium variabile]|uniref:DUF4391 domain-containing protein n=1 Tax=Corynebacterium variabile TaxID=1727 RepID=UPI003FD042F6
MTDVLYRWPAAAEFSRRIPKDKFYGRGTTNAAVKDRFVEEVARITWAYKLATATINLPDSENVPEIQILEVTAKVEDVSDQVLAAIDKAIPSPILFEIVRDHNGRRETRLVAAHKQLGHGAPKISRYFTTGWLPPDAERERLPTSITLPDLYSALLTSLTDVQVQSGEDMEDIADRLRTVSKLERQIKTLEHKLRTEKQLNRRIELNRTLKTARAELDKQR